MFSAPSSTIRVVITGIGVVSPIGTGRDEFWRNCFAGISGIRPITLFDSSRLRCRIGGEISNFNPSAYLGSKGLRNLDRTSLLALVAAKLAIDDARLDLTDTQGDEIGVILGSTMGSVASISEFDKEGLREGPRFVNPAQFPNTVINSPASQVAIRFGLRGINSTISTGFTSSLDAIGYALDILRLGRARRLLVGGVEELCLQTFLGFYKLGLLATSDNGNPLFAPFDLNRSGMLLGEGAAFFVLELLEDALGRHADIYAEVAGYGTSFNSKSFYRYDPLASAPIEAMRDAIISSNRNYETINHVSACANGSRAGDLMEATAIKSVFGDSASNVPVSAVKSILGESFSVGAAMQLCATLGTFQHEKLAPVLSLQNPDPVCGINCTAQSRSVSNTSAALVNSFSPTGIASALVVTRV